MKFIDRAHTVEENVRVLLNKIDKGDIVAMVSHYAPVSFENNRLKSVENNSGLGIGLRLFENDHVGHSYINRLGDTDDIINNAHASAALGDELDLELPGSSKYKTLPHFHKEVTDWSKEKAISVGNTLLKELRAIDSRLQVSVDINFGESYSIIANSSGFFGTEHETHASLYAGIQLVEDNGSLLEIGESDSEYNLDLENDRILNTIEWRYKHAIEKSELDSGYYPVIFTPDAIDLLLQPFEIAFNGKTLYKKLSVLEGRLGETVAGSMLTITDDPFYENGAGSYSFDDEGVIPKAIPLIEKGVFKNFIFDLTTAKRCNANSTGHGSRSISGMPSPGHSNLILGKGTTSLEDMIKSVKKGLFVVDFLGGGMSNILAGDISVNIELGFLIENGQVKGRVKDLMLSGNAFDWWKQVLSIEDRLHKQGSLYAPHVLIENVSVSH